MNLIEFQITKSVHRNLLQFYTSSTKYEREKFKKLSHLPSHQREQNTNEFCLPKETKDLYSKNYILKIWWKKSRNLQTDKKIHVNPWLIHVNIWQKPLQYCKVISLQLIKINEKKKKKKQTISMDGKNW